MFGFRENSVKLLTEKKKFHIPDHNQTTTIIILTIISLLGVHFAPKGKVYFPMFISILFPFHPKPSRTGKTRKTTARPGKTRSMNIPVIFHRTSWRRPHSPRRIQTAPKNLSHGCYQIHGGIRWRLRWLECFTEVEVIGDCFFRADKPFGPHDLVFYSLRA